MTSLHYSVSMSHGRGWGFHYEWWGWGRIFSVGITTNFLAPAVQIVFGGVNIRMGRIPKETVMSGKQLLDKIKKEKE